MPDDPFKELSSHLREMFQFDDTELDFGIYKVLELKQQEIERFIGKEGEQGELKRIVEDALSEAHRQQAEPFYNFMEQAPDKYAPKVKDVEAHYDELREYVEVASEADEEDRLLSALDAAKEGEDDLETRIYNHILNFFQRYYREGDFGYNDRSLQSYQVDYPDEADYDGSDVLFHWKHKDSYYIKTGQGFHSVAFDVDGERIKYVVEQRTDNVAVAQNNNKDDRKHYKFDRIEQVEDGQEADTWRVVFHLAEESTPKTEIFQRLHDTVFGDDVDYDTYLFRGDRPIFTDLEGDYDDVSGGRKKGASGRQSLRLSPEKYSKRLVKNHRKVFEDLGSNDDKRIAALTEEIEQDNCDSLPRRFYTFDKNLNTFYIGQDADYFIHKHLGRFLSREKDRYVKNVIFSDLEALLNMQVDNTSVVIAKAFDRVASRIIDLLAAVEDFQKHLFLLKKKVVDTDYLVSIGKINDVVEDKDTLRDLLKRIVDEPKQRQEWESTFEVELPDDPMQLVVNHPTLPVDTYYFEEDERLKDDLIAQVDDLESEVDGLLIKSENSQALRLIRGVYRDKIDCLYADPPFNTESNSILYKNSFRHSSWLSLMSNRITESSKLLKESGVHIVAIDEHEQEELGLLLDITYPNKKKKCVSIVHNPGGTQGGKFKRSNEYAYFVFDEKKSRIGKKKREKEDWDIRSLRDVSGNNNMREDAKNCFYPIIVEDGNIIEFGDVCDDNFHPDSPNVKRSDGKIEIYPIDPKGNERKWTFARSTVENIRQELFVKYVDNRDVYDIYREKKNFKPTTTWSESKYNSKEYGTDLIKNILGNKITEKKNMYPKSIYNVKDCVRLSTPREGRQMILDYFSGTGTTGHAVIQLNKEDDKTDRQFVLIEMGEYFDDILKERIARIMYSENWTNGAPDNEVDGTQGLVKYQRLEQYEDVLDNLKTDLNGDALPDEVPLTYLYRPQEQALRTSLDLSAPFDQTIKYGPQQEETTLDLLETYAYLKGLPVRQRRRYDREGRVYRTLRSDPHLVVFRPIQSGTDDTDALRDLLEENEGVEVLHVNHDVQRGELKEPRLSLRVVTAEDFDAGTSWT
jgi:adenine-specific DNA-methyltransferase